MIETTRKKRIDGVVRSCRLSFNRRMYFIRSHRMIRATIYDVGEYSAGMTVIGSKRRNIEELQQQMGGE